MLQAAARIADGQVPYRDFWWFYPPGQPYLLGGLVGAVRARRCCAWRIVRVLADAAVALLVYALARAQRPASAGRSWLRWPPRSRWRTRAGRTRSRSRSRSRSGRSLAGPDRPVLAGVLTGACAAWRMEFAALALGARAPARRGPDAR